MRRTNFDKKMLIDKHFAFQRADVHRFGATHTRLLKRFSYKFSLPSLINKKNPLTIKPLRAKIQRLFTQDIKHRKKLVRNTHWTTQRSL